MAEDLIDTLGKWLGEFKGTHVGTAYLELERTEDDVVADLRINIGGKVGKFTGAVELGPPTIIRLNEQILPADVDRNPSTGQINFDVVTPKRLSGMYEFDNGAMGPVFFIRSDQIWPELKADVGTESIQPVHMFERNVPIGAVTVYRKDLESLIEKLRDLFPQRDPAITAEFDDKKVTGLATDFLQRSDLPTSVNDMTLRIDDNDPGIKNVISIYFSKAGNSNILTQSKDETWCTGVTSNMDKFLKRFTSSGTHFYRRFGLEINPIIFIIALMIVPDMNLVNRIFFIILVLLIMFILRWIHGLVPQTTVYLDETKRNPIRRQLPTIVAGIMVAVFGAVIVQLTSLLSEIDIIAQIIK